MVEKYSSNLLIAYLNNNTLQNKVDTLRVITKIFLTPSRRDRNKFMGGKIVYVKDRLLVK